MGYITQENLASKLGKSQSAVANKVRLLNLTDEVQEALLENKISERHARSLLKLTSATQQTQMLNRIINERLTVRRTDEEIGKRKNNSREDETEGTEKRRSNQVNYNSRSNYNSGTCRQDENGSICNHQEIIHAGQDCYCKPGS